MDNITLAISCVNAKFCVLAEGWCLEQILKWFFFNLQVWALQRGMGHKSFQKRNF